MLKLELIVNVLDLVYWVSTFLLFLGWGWGGGRKWRILVDMTKISHWSRVNNVFDMYLFFARLRGGGSSILFTHKNLSSLRYWLHLHGALIFKYLYVLNIFYHILFTCTMNLNTILVLVPINLLNRFPLCMNKMKYRTTWCKELKGKKRY